MLAVWLAVQVSADVTDWIIQNKSRYIGITLQGTYLAENKAKVLFFPVSFHKNQNTGKMSSAVDRAAWQLDSIVSNVIISLAPQFLSIAIGLAVSFYISVFAGAILLIGIAAYVFLLSRILPETVKIRKATNEAWGRAYDDAYQAISNVHAVKQAAAEKYEARNLKKKFVTLAALSWYKVEQLWSKIDFSQKALVTAVGLLIFLFAAASIRSGAMTVGDLIALAGYSAMVFRPFATLGRSWQVIQGGIMDIARVEKMLDQAPEKYHPENAVILKELRGDIEFKNASFSYKRGQKVLDDVSFRVRAGEVVALVGESGVGKSTLIELLSGYYFASGGKVLVDGHDVKRLDLTFLRGNIGVVPQEVVLFNDTVKNNIKYGKFGASEEEVLNAAKEAYADDFIEKFPKKYETVVGERGIKLSVGQKQRIAIARAILRDPKILILDEPTSALDSATERSVTESLEKLMQGRTTFIVAHRLSTVRKADKILVLEGGTIKEAGSHDELMNVEGGVYRHLYEMHIGLE
ncbi:MAG: ABC transporter ATP-binding protein [Parcubacteria group bacterium]|nr:ABC transporter ATP-binding protein [Parcubacteria group bacterium]